MRRRKHNDGCLIVTFTVISVPLTFIYLGYYIGSLFMPPPPRISEPGIVKDMALLNFTWYFSCNIAVVVQGGPKNRTCLNVDNSATVTRRKACNMSKVLECCRQKGPNLRRKLFKYSLPDLHKSSLPLKLGICLHSRVPEFIELKNSLSKSPYLNSVNYSVCGHCNRQHGHKILVTDQLKHVLIECWAQLILNTLTPAIDKLPKRTDDGYECHIWATAYVVFHLNSTYVLIIVDISLYAECKST